LRSRSWFLLVLVVLVGFFLLAKHRYPGKPPVKVPDEMCDQVVWQHVYDPSRLKVIEACTAVVGRVVLLHQEDDGDLHIALDPDEKSVLNLLNAVHTHGTLVVEVVCAHPSSDPEPLAACGSYLSSVVVPRAGDRVRVTGSYVVDTDNGWSEIHPASRIEVLP
jgi:hypothetical protein